MTNTEGLRRLDTFKISKKPIAVDPEGLVLSSVGTARLRAVWFRRRYGFTVACLGTLWDHQDPAPDNWLEFLDRCDTGRYGPDCDGRWDGANYWGSQRPETMKEHLKILRPMMENYPSVPDGYDGWWTFHV